MMFYLVVGSALKREEVLNTEGEHSYVENLPLPALDWRVRKRPTKYERLQDYLCWYHNS